MDVKKVLWRAEALLNTVLDADQRPTAVDKLVANTPPLHVFHGL